MIESCDGCLYDLGGGRDNCCLGGSIVLAFCILAWRMYRIGRGERAQQNVSGRK